MSSPGFAYAALTPYGSAFQRIRLPVDNIPAPALQPRSCRNNHGLGSSTFARRYLRNHYYFLFLRVLRCFSSPRSPQLMWWRDHSRRVAPFGHPRITVYLPLRAAFRSLSRPSSPPRAAGIPRAPLFSFLLAFAFPTRSPSRSQVFQNPCRSRNHSLRRTHARSLFALVGRLNALASNRPRVFYVSIMSMTSSDVENNGFEPLTLCLQSRCSSQLS